MNDNRDGAWAAPTDSRVGLRSHVSRDWRVIVVFALLGLLVAAGFTITRSNTYTGEASLRFRDVSGDLNLLGSSTASEQLPAAVAAQGAEQVKRSGVLQRALRLMRTDPRVEARLRRPPAQAGPTLRDSLRVTIDESSNLVEVSLDAPTARAAAAAVNAVATATVETVNGDQRTTFLAQADRVRDTLRGVRQGGTNARNTVLIESYQSQISRLETLGRVAEPASVAVAAVPPTSPSSPRPVFNVAVGTLIGLLLGLAVAAGRRLLRSAIESVEEIESMGFTVGGSLSGAAFGAVPELFGEIGPNGRKLLESARQVRAVLDFTEVEKRPRVIGVVSALPQEGKSTTAAALAAASAADGRRVLLVDCDLRRPSLPERLSLPAEPGVAEFITADVDPGELLQTLNVTPLVPQAAGVASPELVYLPPGHVLGSPAALLGSSRFKSALAEMSEVYDLVVLDCAPLLPVADTIDLLPHVDALVVCVRLRRTPRRALRSIRATIDRSQVSNVVCMATDSRSGRGGSGYRLGYYDYGYEYGYEANDRSGAPQGRGRGLLRRSVVRVPARDGLGT